jgi:hypothetical protein
VIQYNKETGIGQGKGMVKEVKAATLNDAEVLKVIARFSREIRKTGLGKYFEDEFVRDGWERAGGAFWIFDGPHEDDFAKVLKEKIREVETDRDKRTEKEPP